MIGRNYHATFYQDAYGRGCVCGHVPCGIRRGIPDRHGQRRRRLLSGRAEYLEPGEQICRRRHDHGSHRYAGVRSKPRLVAMGEVELGITNANLAADAVGGRGAYDGNALDIKALGPLHPSVLHMVVADSSDIQSFADLKGKRVAVGPAGGGTMGFLNNMLPVYGLTLDDITPSFLSYGDGFSQLSDGNVDAALALSGYPAAAVMQAAASGKLRMITMDPDKLAQILEENPAYSTYDIAPDVYGMETTATVLGVTNMLIVPASMDVDVASAIVAAIYDHLDEFAAENANARQIDKARAASLSIELHEGAAAYFAQ
ncbi:MAG: TRAP transporter substrate-binding protein [Mameliella sp.]|nr:TRAP transporter substrate-binding protein [Mameliella sp.]